MLCSILYNILDRDEALFYHRFQTEYRHQCHREPRITWNYESLKTVLKSLQDYPLERRLYLIIDAVDESEENDRRDVLKLLFELCSKTKYCVAKVFVASRPVGELDLRLSLSNHNFIRLQDETKRDISSFTRSFLDGLNLTHVLARATEYIVENAQGVFLWVKLVGEELETYAAEGYSEEQTFEFLQGLPIELEDFYTLMFKKMSWDKRCPTNAVKIFRFVLFGRRPLLVDELLHALVIPDDPETQLTLSDDSFQRCIPFERRIIHCGGNFLEIKPHHGIGTTSPDSRISQTSQAAGSGTVQVMHQTVRDYFLNPDGYVAKSGFGMYAKQAHICISITIIRYLILCVANTALPDRSPDVKFWASEHFEAYAQYLDKRPLTNYALHYLKHHINGSQQDENVQNIISQFIDGLVDSPAVYLLESWVGTHLNTVLLGCRQGATAKDFRNKLLHIAARNGFSTAAEALLTAGVDVNAEDSDRRTPLSWAARSGHGAVVKLLLETGKVDVDSKDIDRRTPLSWAARSGHEAVVKLLLETGKVDVDSKDSDRRTPLWWTARSGHEAVVKLLLETGKVYVDLKDNDRRTPLWWAARSGHEAVVKLLLETGKVDVNSKDKDGITPPWWAKENRHEATVKLLLETGKVDVDAAPRATTEDQGASGHNRVPGYRSRPDSSRLEATQPGHRILGVHPRAGQITSALNDSQTEALQTTPVPTPADSSNVQGNPDGWIAKLCLLL